MTLPAPVPEIPAAHVDKAAAQTPWKLRAFMAADLDGNLIRVFYDFRLDV